MIDFIIIHITQNYIDIVASAIGLLYLYLEYKANIWMWLASIIMAIFFIYIFYSSQLYASMIIYIYFFFASIYGWTAWINKNRDTETGEHIILRLPRKSIPMVIVAICIAFILITVLLHIFTENKSYVLLGDALTTALNVVALWMISRKWAEQWCLVIPANLLSGTLLLIQGQPASAIMFYIYFIVSIFGYFKWKKMAN